MSAGRPEIPGGASERARKAGGAALRLQLATLLAGNPIDQVVWALVGEMVSVCLMGCDTREQADQLADQIAVDIKNGIALNWGTLENIEARARMAAVNASPSMRRPQ